MRAERAMSAHFRHRAALSVYNQAEVGSQTAGAA